MDDATSRAREVIRETYGEDGWPVGAITADNIARALAEFHLAIIDTRTHAAVPREPSEADVERVARAIAERWGASFDFNHYDEEEQASWREQARAAIAALVGTQTQGGEPDAPP